MRILWILGPATCVRICHIRLCMRAMLTLTEVLLGLVVRHFGGLEVGVLVIVGAEVEFQSRPGSLIAVM